jgi:hypothetical protein
MPRTVGPRRTKWCAWEALYRGRYRSWNVEHFRSFYRRRHSGERSYTWVKTACRRRGWLSGPRGQGRHPKRRERAPLLGIVLHQNGSTHERIEGVYWDLIVTMDEATNEHSSMFFVDQDGTASSFRGVRETIAAHGLFRSLYTARASRHWHAPEASCKVDRHQRAQFARAMEHLGIEMIPAYSPKARGRSERAF